MPPAPIDYSSALVDLSQRFQGTSTVVASPAAGAETIIASLALADFGNLTVVSGIRLHGFAAFTVGTDGVSANLRIRQTDVNGSVVKTTGAVIAVATNLLAMNVLGLDASPGVKTYVLTLTVGSGSAPSTVSAVHLAATVI
jgi:hypothetical protein